jgi:hypothetical protein
VAHQHLIAPGEVDDLQLREVGVGHRDHGAVEAAHAGWAQADLLDRAHLVAEQAELADRTGLSANRMKPPTLPFPRLDSGRIAALDGSLDFPPKGSADYSQPSEAARPKATHAARRRWGARHPTRDG